MAAIPFEEEIRNKILQVLGLYIETARHYETKKDCFDGDEVLKIVAYCTGTFLGILVDSSPNQTTRKAYEILLYRDFMDRTKVRMTSFLQEAENV